MKKDARLFLRVSFEDKEFLQKIADEACDGNISKVIDQLILDLRSQKSEEAEVCSDE